MIDVLTALVDVALDVTACFVDGSVAGRRTAATVNARQIVPSVDSKVGCGGDPKHPGG
ncbi:conserved hypothetical protein [Mesorhizobium delmotii]|uniref:Uncharacterized protein n=1 Tax=Mesorhizobium delmotii TaxID=1631247 RepID=A0A2P9AS57_9HYPH|nr:conserved hypothetical protein [Mesorhizobium delmotii]